MNKELKELRNSLVVSIRHAIERMRNATLSEHDRILFSDMLLRFARAVMKDSEYMKETAMQRTADNILDVLDDLANGNVDSLEYHYDELVQLSAFGEIVMHQEDFDRFRPREDGRTYIDFLPESMTNEQSDQIVAHLKSIGAKFDPEVGQWYVEKDWQMPQFEQQNEKENQIESGQDAAIVQIKVPYLSKESFKEAVSELKQMGVHFDRDKRIWYAERSDYLKAALQIQKYLDTKSMFKVTYYENSEKKNISAETKEDALEAARFDKADIKKTDRCYVSERDEFGKYQRDGVYLIESGRDITPVISHLPYMSSESFSSVLSVIKDMGAKFNVKDKVWYVERGKGQETIDAIKDYLQQHDEGMYLKIPEEVSSEQFRDIIKQFKQDGARYNPDKKAWYITDKNDRSKFSAYLPSDKTSIREKLEQNKERATDQNKSDRKMPERSKDDHERA